ncbi:uncharacterized protein SPPG_06434 [Spizellomyces punctatus DAOM BR117]|uniref:FAD dependent oxidoreductase domain-containing protein n=1 Tax=Spizellomyces punctatus (strain DAOM BR117) TaxID=645134 RepID=A0A0L0H904_SPIPD|nr:uncharacterized protein SPPG_06434 [Spizellomyces punctatus DAOM BR117]KNC98015.1 hypothetical protein SPPG_06434 [Spizellomyces punctatus DAOM BR117]|eukprot:XP_016606055.1 hypothetical protein SPPG_06434 [Spizellomyces punctatus DAOM BR117]
MRVIVVVGAGSIGSNIAYHLVHHASFDASKDKVIVIDREGVACAASGKAGGFLAQDWSDGTPLQSLARASFKRHAELAKLLNVDYGYRPMDTLHVAFSERGGKKSVWWLNQDKVSRVSVMGTTSNTAQVHPRLLMNALMDDAVKNGAQLVLGTVVNIDTSTNTIHYIPKDASTAEETMTYTDIIIAMGPWTGTASAWIPNIPSSINGFKAPSIVFKTSDLPQMVSPHAIFTQISMKGKVASPEIYPRPDGTVYICGECITPDTLPPSPADVAPSPADMEELKKLAAQVIPDVAACPVIAEQACYVPVPPGNVPVMGRVKGYDNVYVAAGHTVWGILNGPGTGMVISELVLSGQVTCGIDVSGIMDGGVFAVDE